MRIRVSVILIVTELHPKLFLINFLGRGSRSCLNYCSRNFYVCHSILVSEPLIYKKRHTFAYMLSAVMIVVSAQVCIQHQGWNASGKKTGVLIWKTEEDQSKGLASFEQVVRSTPFLPDIVASESCVIGFDALTCMWGLSPYRRAVKTFRSPLETGNKRWKTLKRL